MRPITWKKLKTVALGVVCFFICIILFVAGLYPFNFKQQNKVEWLPAENGIRFFGRGIVYSSSPFNSPKDPHLQDTISIEFWAQPSYDWPWGVPKIIAFCDEHKAESFNIGQWGSSLILRYRNKNMINMADVQKAYKEIGLADALTKETRHFIAITAGKEGTALYLDGRLSVSGRGFIPPSGNIESAKYLVLGNSPSGHAYWDGKIFGLAIYNRCLTAAEISQSYLSWKQSGGPGSKEEGFIALYLFDEGKGNLIKNHQGSAPDLEIPKSFRPLKRVVLLPPWKEFRISRSYAMDVFINGMGFVPFGFFFTAFFLNIAPLPRRRVYFLTLLLGGAISLAIELAQVYLPGRDSSLGDLIYNIAGTAAGIILYSFWLAILRARKRT